MTEPARSARMRAAALAGAAGVVLCLLSGVGGVVAALSLWLAQPALALAVSWARGTRTVPSQPRAIAQTLPPLLAIWGVGLLALAALISWPLTALRDSGSLAAALALSVAVSAALLGLWRTWPLWGEVERDGGALAPRWQALATQELHAWRGLLAAVLVLAMCTLAVVLAWPGWLSGGLRWGLAVAAAVLLPAAHLLLQRSAAPRAALRRRHAVPPISSPKPQPNRARWSRWRSISWCPNCLKPRAVAGWTARCNCLRPVPTRRRCRCRNGVTNAACRRWRRCCRICACYAS